MDVVYSVKDSDAEPMYTEMLEDITDSSQYCLSVDSREARYKICGSIKQSQL